MNKYKILSFIILLLLLGYFYYVYNQNKKESQTAVISPQFEKIVTNKQSEIVIPIMIDTQGRTINALELHLKYDPEYLEVLSLSKEPSFIKLWIKDEPKFSKENGEISFAGGLPNPGFNGRDVVGSVKLMALKTGKTEISYNSKTRILLNDGKGTSLPLTVKPIIIQIKE